MVQLKTRRDQSVFLIIYYFLFPRYSLGQLPVSVCNWSKFIDERFGGFFTQHS